jgi:hypothetical protein
VTRPTADSTAAAESWLRSQENLRFLVDTALRDTKIDEALANANISADEARAVILENRGVLARLRITRHWPKQLLTNRVQRTELGLPPKRLRNASPTTRITTGALAVLVYVALFMASWMPLPWPGNLLGLVGFLATLVWAVGLVGEDLLFFFATREAQDPADWWDHALNKIVIPELWRFINGRRAPDYGTTLSIRGMHDLYEDRADAPVIITSAGQRLWRVIDRSTSDAVAIAGHRGIGKTTTIRATARGVFSEPGAPPSMSVIASAPSRYEARDFVLHLHAALAKEVLALTGRLLHVSPAPEQRRRRDPAIMFVLKLSAVLVALTPFAYLACDGTFGGFLADMRDVGSVAFAEFPRHVFEPVQVATPDTARSVTVAMLYYALCLVIVVTPLAGMGFLARLPGALRRANRRDAMPAVVELHDLARQQLDRIRFLQTYTSGWSGKVGIPLGSSDVSWTRGSQRAEQQLTHPEVVEAFREFAGRASAVLIREQGVIERIVVAVDELDKIAEPEKAHEFVNDIKGIFGVDGCLFLVAVSDDAIAAFERRGIPVRDAFDSAFSEMVRMDAFTLAESRRWLDRRLVGVPEPFGCLCHCLSGGLPRDLRRSTVDMIDAARQTGDHDLESVAALMIDRELDRKAHAFAAAVRRLDDHPEVIAHLADLLLVGQAREPAELVELSGRIAPGEESTIPIERWQSACFVLFCATLLEVFTNELTGAELDSRIELLGTARTQLAVDPRVAWRLVCDIRASYGLAPTAASAARDGSARPAGCSR